MVMLYIIHNKFKSTLAKIVKIYKNASFFNKYASFVGDAFFAGKKTPGGHAAGLAPGVWSYPITFRSLVVKHTALTQTFSNFKQISKVF